MTIEEMIAELIQLRSIHGKDARILANHGETATPYFIPPGDGCPGYISLESE
ncbi:MAG: hypothetical protein HIU83_00985 [Proteobacteria bacterium]|nr:hypothetical protein [Pseudomonadota bacterium]